MLFERHFLLMKKNQHIGCKRFYGIVKNETDKTVKIAQLRCKQWDCSYCAIRNAKQWRAAIIDYVFNNPHDAWSFMTFTVPAWVRKHPQDKRYEISLKIVKEKWDTLMKRLKRMFGKFEYVRVIEQHKDGTIHIHLLASCYIEDCRKVTRKDGSVYYYNREIKRHAVECGFGYILDTRNLMAKNDFEAVIRHAGGVAGYVTKYITKDLETNDKSRKSARVRKIQTSRGIKRVNLKNEEVWEYKTGYWFKEWLEDSEAGKVVRDVSTREKITKNDFEIWQVYPPPKRDDDSS